MFTPPLLIVRVPPPSLPSQAVLCRCALCQLFYLYSFSFSVAIHSLFVCVASRADVRLVTTHCKLAPVVEVFLYKPERPVVILIITLSNDWNGQNKGRLKSAFSCCSKTQPKKPCNKALIGPQKQSDKAWKIVFTEPRDCAGVALNGLHASFLNSLAEQKNGPLFEYCPDPWMLYPAEKKNAPFIVSFLPPFSSYSGVLCEESAGFVYGERPWLCFHSWRRCWGGGKKKNHVPRQSWASLL